MPLLTTYDLKGSVNILQFIDEMLSSECVYTAQTDKDMQPAAARGLKSATLEMPAGYSSKVNLRSQFIGLTWTACTS